MFLPLGDRFRELARSHSRWVVGQLRIEWLLGRLREQARSHSRWVVGQLGIGWLSGRHRWQASSHRRQDQDQKIAAFGSSCIWIALGFG